MLQITIPAVEKWDELNEEFVRSKEQTLTLEHSLVSVSKWESKWKKPFLTRENKTINETIDYIRCMTITQNVNPSIYENLTNENVKEITEYIDNPMTATRISQRANAPVNREIITSEIIYYWMIVLNIPMECQKWHLNRLMTLIQVCNIKNQPGTKMSRKEVINRNRALNASRKTKYKSRG